MAKIPSLADLYEYHLQGTELLMDGKKVFVYSTQQIPHDTLQTTTHWFRLSDGTRIMYEVPMVSNELSD